MSDAPATRASLLVRLRDAKDREACARFAALYGPLVHGFARKRGLQDADAADLTQEVLRAVAAAAERLTYDPQRGSFRGWLFTVVRNELRNFLTKQRRQPQGSGDSGVQGLLDGQPAPEDERRLWDEEHERRLFHWAAEGVRREVEETTWRAFWLTAVEGKSGRETADALGVSVAAVYLAKSRVMARLKEHVRQLEQGEP
jgi:RNA polymerase sigma-70 factor (ECF subfamily)